MFRNTQSLRRVAGVVMLIIGITQILAVQLPANLNSGLPLLVAGIALLGSAGRPNIGIIVMSVWLFGLAASLILGAFPSIVIPSFGTILAIVALLAGVLLILDR